MNGNLIIAKILIDANANINIRNINNFTPIHFAIRNEHLKMLKYLLKLGAKIKIQSHISLLFKMVFIIYIMVCFSFCIIC